MRKLSPDHCPVCATCFAPAEPVEPRHQRTCKLEGMASAGDGAAASLLRAAPCSPPPAPPSSFPRRTGEYRRCAGRSPPRISAGSCCRRPAFDDGGHFALRRPVQRQAVTCACPIQGGENSGRNATIISAGRRGARAIMRSSSSRQVGSVQCASSKINSAGCRRDSATSFEQRRERPFALLRISAARDSGLPTRAPAVRRRARRPAFTSQFGEQRLELVEPGRRVILALETRRRARAAQMNG